MNLNLSITIEKIHSRTVLMKKQQNFEIHLQLNTNRNFTIKLTIEENDAELNDVIFTWLEICLLQKLAPRHY